MLFCVVAAVGVGAVGAVGLVVGSVVSGKVQFAVHLAGESRKPRPVGVVLDLRPRHPFRAKQIHVDRLIRQIPVLRHNE